MWPYAFLDPFELCVSVVDDFDIERPESEIHPEELLNILTLPDSAARYSLVA